MKTYLICYDIEGNKLRKKIADRLIADGLERVQYSVFMGPVSASVLAKLEKWLQTAVEGGEGKGDRAIILPLQLADVEKMLILEMPLGDLGSLTDGTHTLFL